VPLTLKGDPTGMLAPFDSEERPFLEIDEARFVGLADRFVDGTSQTEKPCKLSR
jgi:hypothetical protein